MRAAFATRVLLYEWCCSGGVVGHDPAIASEGRTMLEAIAVDAARDGGLEVAVLVSERATVDLPAGVRIVSVRAGDDERSLVAAARHADWTLIVAPETDGVLARRVAAVRDAGRRVLACDGRFIEVAADKQATIDALAAAGLPVSAGRPLAAGEPWPESFVRPAVRKPRFGVGCEGFTIVGRGEAAPAPSAAPARLEAFAGGDPVGVSCVCGPSGIHPLPALRQIFFAARPASYAGGRPLDDPAAAARAGTLAIRAIAAVARSSGDAAAGWVGVDMVLGHRADGRDDRVLEVNPRVTTSFVGHARGLNAALVRAMLDAAEGRPIRLPGPPLPFDVKADATACTRA